MIPPTPLHKVCGKCHEEKPSIEFYTKSAKSLNGPRRLDSVCKKCRNIEVKAYQAARPEQTKAYKQRWYDRVGKTASRAKFYKRFNANEAAYDVQFHAQEGRCAICLREPRPGEFRFAFDHCHTTGKARGVLCSACNGGLGCFSDRPELLRAAFTYLAAWAREHEELKAVNGL